MLWTPKVWIVSRLVRTRLVGKNSEECSATTSRNEMEVNTKLMTRSLFTLQHLGPCRLRMSEMRHAQREKCACVRVLSGVLSTPSVAFRAVATVWTRNPEKKTTTNQQLRLLSCWTSVEESQDGGQVFWLMVTTSDLSFGLNQFPGAWIDFMENVSRCCLILPFFRPRTVFPIVLMPVRSPGGRGPPG